EGWRGKSVADESTLMDEGHPHKVTNIRVSFKGLFDLLRDHPDVVHVVDDAEALLADKHAVSVLRSALWGQVDTDGKQRRLVTWVTNKHPEEVVFVGGLILIGNVPFGTSPDLRALQTRVP